MIGLDKQVFSDSPSLPTVTFSEMDRIPESENGYDMTNLLDQLIQADNIINQEMVFPPTKLEAPRFVDVDRSPMGVKKVIKQEQAVTRLPKKPV